MYCAALRLKGKEKEIVSFEEFCKKDEALTGFPYATREEMEGALGDAMSAYAGAIEEHTDPNTGRIALFDVRQAKPKAVTKTTRTVRNALVKMLRGAGVNVHYVSGAEAQAMLDKMNGAQMSAKQKNLLKAVTMAESNQPTNPATATSSKGRSKSKSPKRVAASDVDGAKLVKNLEAIKQAYENRRNPKGFITDISQALGLTQDAESHYSDFVLPNGRKVTLRISNHNAAVANFDNHGATDGVSIIITQYSNKGLKNNGVAHVAEIFLDKKDIKANNNSPLSAVANGISQFLQTGELNGELFPAYAQYEEVNRGVDPRFLHQDLPRHRREV